MLWSLILIWRTFTTFTTFKTLCVAVGTSNMWLTKLLRIALVVSFQALTLLCRLFLLCVRLFDRFFIFIWNGVYYSVISQKIYFYLVAAFKFFVTNESRLWSIRFLIVETPLPNQVPKKIVLLSIFKSLLFHMIVFFIPGLVLSCISLNSNQCCSVLM